MGIEAVNTARLPSPLPANVFTGNGARNTRSTRTEKAPGQLPVSNTPISEAVMKALNNDMKALHRVGLQFSVHEDTGQTVVRVVDKDTGKLIRQIPPQELLDLAAKLEDMMGMLFDKQV
jgi:flagellar protein FlaG